MSGLWDERSQVRDDLVFHEAKDHLKHDGEFVPQIISDTKRYCDETIDLHIHFAWMGSEYCAILHGGGESPDLHTIAEDSRFLEGGPRKYQLSVFVGILESVEHSEEVVGGFVGLFTRLPSLLKRLQSRQNCDRVAWNAFGVSHPGTMSVRISVFPGRPVDFERICGEDRKLCSTFVLTWNESAEQMVKGRPDVEQEITRHDGDVLVERQAQGDCIFEITIGLEHFSHRAVVSVSGKSNQGFQLIEMLLCPVELEIPRSGHDLPLEDDAKVERPQANTGGIN